MYFLHKYEHRILKPVEITRRNQKESPGRKEKIRGDEPI
jgi:hypothetical protein